MHVDAPGAVHRVGTDCRGIIHRDGHSIKGRRSGDCRTSSETAVCAGQSDPRALTFAGHLAVSDGEVPESNGDIGADVEHHAVCRTTRCGRLDDRRCRCLADNGEVLAKRVATSCCVARFADVRPSERARKVDGVTGGRRRVGLVEHQIRVRETPQTLQQRR